MFNGNSLRTLQQVRDEINNVGRLFPLAIVTESFLKEIGVKFTTFPCRGGVDVTGAQGYEITLPQKIDFSSIDRSLMLPYIVGRIIERHYRENEPKVLENRPDLTNPMYISSERARFDAGGDGRLIDIVEVRVKQ